MRFTVPIIALESNQAKEAKETEIVVYTKVSKPEGLEQASRKEGHVQLEGKFHNGTKCRVRKVSDNGDKYFFTFKVKSQDDHAVDAYTEYTVEVDQDFFQGFKSVAERMLVKTRYVFDSKDVTMTLKENGEDKLITIPNIQYEVDVYQKEDGTLSQWCKIDIEVDNILNFIAKEHEDVTGLKLNIKVSHLPFAPEQSILASEANDQQQAQISEIWEEFAQKVK